MLPRAAGGPRSIRWLASSSTLPTPCGRWTGRAVVPLVWLRGAYRLDTLDSSMLVTRIGHVDRTVAEVTAPARHGQFGLRVLVHVRQFGDFAIDESALLELPLGRAPPQGAVIETVAEV